jgi:Ran GTPase-activating protein (RanGAP) involved in mRNA processing and transport
MEVLELEGCRLTDVDLALIAPQIIVCYTLSVLNFSKNQISDKGVKPICDIIDECVNIKGLFLHYNNILVKGGIKLAESIRNNQFLEVFDISYNSIGGGIDKRDEKKAKEMREKCSKAWSDCFKFNQTLIHVDISHNHLRKAEVEVIGLGLKYNHNILGIHLIGNEGQVDHNGFIIETGALDKDETIAKE